MKKFLIVLGALAALSGVSVAAAVGMGWLEFKNAEYATNPCRAGHECVYPSSVDHKPHAVDSLGNELGAWGASGGGGGTFTGGPVTSFISYGGTSTVVPASPWIACTFQNSWADLGSGNSTCAYFKDSTGIVHLRGRVAGGTANTAIFTLPVGYRATNQEVFTQQYFSGSILVDFIVTDSTGAVSQSNGSGTTWQNLDGISFLSEQ